MNDRYLYRAKRTDNGEWVKGFYCKWIKGKRLICYSEKEVDCIITWMSNGGMSRYEVDPSTICQCTGLKDKNGKLIWENDIIKHYNDTSHPYKYDKGIVRWNDFNIRFERYSTDMKGNVCMNRDCVYEAIGNIFDNLDLLEV